MKFIKAFVFALFFAPCVSFAASNDFMVAAQLLAAAKNADVQQVQLLVNNGADVNYVDATGLSIVCTALLNNDIRAAQILQMYGADASKCDNQIKKYKNKNKVRDAGGLFSGLSSVQTLSLAAAGAAVVVGGLFLLTDAFDPGNDNDAGGAGGGGGNTDEPSGPVTPGAAGLKVAYGPAYMNADGTMTQDDTVYQNNLTTWNPSYGGLRQLDFDYFRPDVQAANNFYVDGIKVPVQNYLLMMHGYSAFANGYMGKTIFREKTNHNPVPVGNAAGGGEPVRVGLITANGLNPTGSAGRAEGVLFAASAATDANTFLVDKYLNYENPVNNVLGAEKNNFDLSGSGTAMNPFATAYDSALGKIVAGWESGGRSYGDFYGFVPNGRLAIHRTGNGKQWADVENPTEGNAVGTVTDTDVNNKISAGDTIVLDEQSYLVSLATDSAVVRPVITVNGTNYDVAQNSNLLVAKCTGDNCTDVSDIAIYQGTDGLYYINTSGGNGADSVLVLDAGNLYAQKELVDADYKNFQALYNSRNDGADVIANVSVIVPARENDYLTIRDMPAFLALSSLADIEDFKNQIDAVYEKNSLDATSQGAYANLLFNSYGSSSPIMVMPAGEYVLKVGDVVKSPSVLDATFENYAPLLYGANLNQRFMTVVAVMQSNGTDSADSIADYGNGGGEFGKLYLSMWSDAETDTMYSSRKCGVAGSGAGGVDPWCFAAAGATAEMATAAAAGAVASVQAAFDYMSNEQVYQLLALTADGYLLGTDASGAAFQPDTLAAYLQAKYSLPPEYYQTSLSADEYLKAFADVYGYGLINLERAMTPGKSVYYYNGNRIVSADGNAYWRSATNTTFRPSAVLNLRGASVSAPFYDVVQSVDGKMTLPRVWKNEFAIGPTDKSGLYMGDVLGELKTRRENDVQTMVGNIGLSMAMSERAYDDNMNGLDNLSLGYAYGNWGFGADYQRYFTDGESRFDGLANPILGLASNVISSDVKYMYGNWMFGGRVFSGAITDEGLLENDPAISAQYMPAKLGLIQGGSADIAWKNGALNIGTSIGFVRESDTLLGAQTGGLLNLGAGDTTFIDAVVKYNLFESVNFVARATFARTVSDASGDVILGLGDIYSDSFAIGANVGNFEFAVSQPLAIVNGDLQYAYADYRVTGDEMSGYVLDIADAYVADLSLKPDSRELRFSGTYRHKFGEFTDGAFGFIYRVNPNHTDDFGNESVFMMKLTHRLGI